MTGVPTRRPAPRPAPVTELADRVQAGRAARRSRVRRRAGRGLLLLAALGGLAWVLLGSTWLAVDRVQVVGQSRVTAAEVERATAVRDGTPLARVDTAAAERRVGRIAAVAAVEVTRSWPGTLRVEVTERVAAAWTGQPSDVVLVDPSGVLFGAASVPPAGVVRLQVTAPGPDDPTTRAAMAVLRSLPAALAERVRIVRAASPSAVVLLTADGKQVVWGSTGDTDDKAAAALALLRTGSAVIDVSTPGVATRRG